MSTTELILNMLAETSTTDISKAEKPRTFNESRAVAQRGGNVAGIARKALEAETKQPVISSMNAIDFKRLLTDIIENSASLPPYEVDTDNSEDK